MALQNRALAGGVVMPEVTYQIEVTAQEFGYILAGLKLYRQKLGSTESPSWPALAASELDKLLRRLNGGPR